MDAYVFPFEKLDVYQLSIDLAEYVLDLLQTFPANRYIRLVGQMEAAVTSPAQNTAEGKGRQYKKELKDIIHILPQTSNLKRSAPPTGGGYLPS